MMLCRADSLGSDASGIDDYLQRGTTRNFAVFGIDSKINGLEFDGD